ncbi:hypothetical protein [Mycobacterium phage WXIN]|nr:hypothetical protein [Mycobacterium phage WXIN]
MRLLTATLAGVVVVLMFSLLILMIGLLLVSFPVWLPMDWVLRHSGRHGFVRFADDGYHFSLIFSPESFKKAYP